MTNTTIPKPPTDSKVTCLCGRELVPGEGGVYVCVICSMDQADCRCFARATWPSRSLKESV